MRQEASVEAIEVAYRGGYDRFVRLASAVLNDPVSGADAVQEGFAQAVRARHTYRADAPLEAWLWRIVLNAALAIRRSSREESTPDPETFVQSAPGPSGSTHAPYPRLTGLTYCGGAMPRGSDTPRERA